MTCLRTRCIATLALLAVLPAFGQTIATTGKLDFKAERARLAKERQAIELRFANEQKACYQKFVVDSCLRESRIRRRTETDDLRRQEATINDIERQRRGAAQIERLDEKKAAADPDQEAAKREQSRRAQQDREQRATDHAKSREQLAAETAERQRAFDAKQSQHAQEQQKVAERQADIPKQRQRYEDKLKKSEAHRADRERRNADNTKPRSPTLPPPS